MNPITEFVGECWKPVVGYEGWYEVSDMGRVKRVRGPAGTRIGRLLTPNNLRGGYTRVELSMGGKKKRRPVHLLIAKAFLTAPSPSHEAHHVNGTRNDNRLANLEYLTIEEHRLRSSCISRQRNGERRRGHLKPKQVSFIKKQLSLGIAQGKIAAIFGVTRNTIHQIKIGSTWRKVV